VCQMTAVGQIHAQTVSPVPVREYA
jgi:hypothetical protein